MNTTNIEWMRAKAEQMLRNQVEQIAKSEFPAGDLAEGMLEMSYALGLTDDGRHAYWSSAIGLAVMSRRQELNNLKCRAMYDVTIGELTEEYRKLRKSPVITVRIPGEVAPVMVNGELINGGGL